MRYLTIKEQPDVDITTNPNTAILHSVRMDFLLCIHKGHKCNLDFYIFHSCKPCLSPICFYFASFTTTHFADLYLYYFIITISHLSFERNTTMRVRATIFTFRHFTLPTNFQTNELPSMLDKFSTWEL